MLPRGRSPPRRLKICEKRGRLAKGVAITFVVPQTPMEMLQAQNDSSRVYIGADEMGGTGIGDPDPDVAAVSAAATDMAASVVAGGDRIACKVIPATTNKIPAAAPARCRHIACSSFDLTRARAKGGEARVPPSWCYLPVRQKREPKDETWRDRSAQPPIRDQRQRTQRRARPVGGVAEGEIKPGIGKHCNRNINHAD